MRIKRSLRFLMLGSLVSFLLYGGVSLGVYLNSVSSSQRQVVSLLQRQKNDPVSYESGDFVFSSTDRNGLVTLGINPDNGSEGVQKTRDEYIGYALLSSDRYAVVQMKVPQGERMAFYNLAIFFPLFSTVDLSVFVLSLLLEKKALVPITRSLEQLYEHSGDNQEVYLTDPDSKVMVSILQIASARMMTLTKEAKDSSERMLNLLNYLPSGLILLNPKDKPLLINKACSDIFTKVYPDSLSSDKVEQALDLKIRDLLKQKRSSSFYWERNGKVFNVDVEILSDKGTAILFNDVTEQRKIEETKRDFFIYASHQMKTPLTSILGYLEMIQDGIVSDPKEIQEMIGDALQGAKKLRDMIKDMLDLSKTESDRARVLEDVDMADSANQVIKSLKEECLVSNVRIIKDLQETFVRMDKVDCERLLANLIGNGIKYNRPGGYVVVSVNNEKRSLVVKDNGVGIPQEDLHRIYERFYRGSNVKSDGTGLGLAIVKHICQRYGFSIDVHSTVGAGTTFIVKF